MGDIIEFPSGIRQEQINEEAIVEHLLNLDESYCFLFKSISETYTGDDLSQNIFLEQLIESALLSFYACGVEGTETVMFIAFQEYFPHIQIDIEKDDG